MCVSVYVYYTFVPVVIVETRIMCYVYILYCSISARRTVTQIPWKFQLVASVTYHLRIHETQFHVLTCPAVWWLSVELKH